MEASTRGISSGDVGEKAIAVIAYSFEMVFPYWDIKVRRGTSNVCDYWLGILKTTRSIIH
jgi:hypothetical protein